MSEFEMIPSVDRKDVFLTIVFVAEIFLFEISTAGWLEKMSNGFCLKSVENQWKPMIELEITSFHGENNVLMKIGFVAVMFLFVFETMQLSRFLLSV